MSKINTGIIKNRCVLLITDLRKMSSEFAAYNGKVAQIEARAELTAMCAEQRPLVRLPAATRRSTTATFIKGFR